MAQLSRAAAALPTSLIKRIRIPASLGTKIYSDRLESLSQSDAFYNLLDRLWLFSPRTWYGILHSQTQNDFNAFDRRELASALASSLLPLVVLAYLFHRFGTIRQREFLWRTVGPASMLSPWTLSALAAFTRQCQILVTALTSYWNGRVEAMPSAILARKVRLDQGRMIAHRRYDVYMPTPDNSDKSDCTKTETNLQEAILLLPGFGISHIAYAEVACRLSDAGLVVVVASMEPLRIPHRHLGADVRSMTRVMMRVQDGKKYKWHLLGHSAGAFGAMYLYDRLRKAFPTHGATSENERIRVGKLVLWGVAAMLNMSTDLSYLKQDQNVSQEPAILLVQATADSIVELMAHNQEKFDATLPVGLASTHLIKEGTHHGFASYAPSQFGSAEGTGTTLSHTAQQDQACEQTLSFLRLGDTVKSSTTE